MSVYQPVHQNYLKELEIRGFKSDPAQLRAIDALERCAFEWAAYKEKRSSTLKNLVNRPPIPRGNWLWMTRLRLLPPWLVF